MEEIKTSAGGGGNQHELLDQNLRLPADTASAHKRQQSHSHPNSHFGGGGRGAPRTPPPVTVDTGSRKRNFATFSRQHEEMNAAAAIEVNDQ